MNSPVGASDFRHALGMFATGVGVVTCVAPDGSDHAMTANAISSVSLRPPLILVAVARSARFHDAMVAVPHWVVSVLAEAARDSAAWLATSGRPLAGQLDRVPHRRTSRGIPLLTESLAVLECRTVNVIEAGDHDIVIGEVEAATVTDDPAAALLYWRSEYRALPPPPPGP